jgi:DNA replication protein DnaC
MAKKHLVPYQGRKFFRSKDQYDPIDNILAEFGNLVLTQGYQWASGKLANKLRLGGISAEEQIKLNRSLLSVKKIELGIAGIERKEAEAIERAEQLKLRLQKQELDHEKRSRLLDLEIQEKELQVERARQRLEDMETRRGEHALNIRVEPISGALEVCANSEGLSSAVEQVEAYEEWVGSLKEGKVFLILGKRGSGKSAFVAKIAEFLMAVYGMPTYWIGAPEVAQQLVPHWIKLVDTPENCPTNSFVMCDETGISYLSLLFNTTKNRFIRRLLMIARQKYVSLAFAAQSSRDVDWAIVRQADSIIFKEPGLHQPDSERPDIKAKAKKAAFAFKEISKEERIGVAYVFDDCFTGIIKSNLPSFWTEDLSHIYAHLDLSQIENGNRGKERLQLPVGSETNKFNNDSIEQTILELHQQGNGIEKIAKVLGCTTWTVRKCLDKHK